MERMKITEEMIKRGVTVMERYFGPHARHRETAIKVISEALAADPPSDAVGGDDPGMQIEALGRRVNQYHSKQAQNNAKAFERITKAESEIASHQKRMDTIYDYHLEQRKRIDDLMARVEAQEAFTRVATITDLGAAIRIHKSRDHPLPSDDQAQSLDLVRPPELVEPHHNVEFLQAIIDEDNHWRVTMKNHADMRIFADSETYGAAWQKANEQAAAWRVAGEEGNGGQS